MSLNKSIIIGRLTKDVEIRTTQSDKSVASFTLASNRNYTNGDHPEADFIDCVAWEQKAEFIQKYFSKGSEMCVVGRLQTRNYENSDGVKRKITEIIVEEVNFVGKKSDNPSNSETSTRSNTKQQNQTEGFNDTLDDDELPF